jgi:hypothetical protein
LLSDSLPHLLPAPAAQDHQVVDLPGQSISEALKVLVPFGQDQWRSACLHGLDDVVTDAAITDVVLNECSVEKLKLDSFVRGLTAALQE